MRTSWWSIAPVVLALSGLGACSPGTGGDAQGGGGSAQNGNAGGSGGTGGSVSDGGEHEGGSGAGTVDPCAGVDCEAGEICDGGSCVPGCDTSEDCEAGLSCCSGGCVDIATDVGHCGMCDDPCAQPDNTVIGCNEGICQSSGCEDGFFECNGDADDGCESASTCNCTPGEEQPCYEGPPGTAGQGICTEGHRICNQAGTAWSLCFDWQGPRLELCANGVDEDCTGTADDVADLDGDGWTQCNGDCCENAMDCSVPARVNPGAFEFVGNNIDDDCDATTSDAIAVGSCSTTAAFSNVSPMMMAQAIDLCQTTTANAPLPQKKWGVVNASYRLANGNVPSTAQLNNMQGFQGAVLQNYGTGGVVPQKGPTMAGISTGRMRDQNDTGYVAPNNSAGDGGTSFSITNQGGPAAYLASHAGSYPSSAGCSGNCPAGAGAYDSINLRLDIRVPTNALSMSYKFRFYSAEYWEYSCTPYNDFYLALLSSGAVGIPADKNISFDALNNAVSVNNGFFESCQMKGCHTCPAGTMALQGTGMNLLTSSPSGQTGGGTSWLLTTAPVVPGETMTIEFTIFDVSDSILDSLTLLDQFEWSLSPSGVGTGPAG